MNNILSVMRTRISTVNYYESDSENNDFSDEEYLPYKHIKNAQSARSSSLITTGKAGVLNEKMCNKKDSNQLSKEKHKSNKKHTKGTIHDKDHKEMIHSERDSIVKEIEKYIAEKEMIQRKITELQAYLSDIESLIALMKN